jgi:hypothetical protein
MLCIVPSDSAKRLPKSFHRPVTCLVHAHADHRPRNYFGTNPTPLLPPGPLPTLGACACRMSTLTFSAGSRSA